MPEKSVSPLNNPPSQKSVVADAPGKSYLKPDSDSSDGRGKGVSKGGKERVKHAEAILKCQMCGREQKLTFAASRPPEWHRCTWCGELQPVDGYRVTAYGLELPRVLAPHEVKAREAYLIALHEGGKP